MMFGSCRKDWMKVEEVVLRRVRLTKHPAAPDFEAHGPGTDCEKRFNEGTQKGKTNTYIC